VHHNAITDQGRSIDNRHRMCCAVRLDSDGGAALHHNLIGRARQSACGNAGRRVDAHHNELHIDSHAINSFGIAVKDDSRVHHNWVFGCGDNAVGLVTTGGCAHVELFGNYVWLQAHSLAAYFGHLSMRPMESAGYSIMSGTRITWGCRDVDYHHNVILVTAREGGFVRGTFFYNDHQVHQARCRDSLIIALAEDELSHGWGAVAGVGNETRGQVELFPFTGNTIVSNFACFNMQDPYGVAVGYLFADNLFVRVGQRPDFATVRARCIRPSQGHILRDNRYATGAELEHVLLGPDDEFRVEWTCKVRTTAGAEVAVRAATGEAVFAGHADAAGELDLVLVHYHQRGRQRRRLAPYTLHVTSAGRSLTRCIEALASPVWAELDPDEPAA